ncbi:MAG: ParB/RepB/Spo0J family partition protein, partial [Nitrosopumilaceae archaeon]|nr:ParB/RepB/Spo0J family partition protein [Nitrosopumilaceae archaeon]NIX61626.1 ParB/RepB/Spo0J family partition protein [Nitrosopumilaceae archaeon]
KSKRLGRGLNALIPTENSTDGDVKTSNMQELDVLLIETNPRQPRVVFNDVSLQELKDSIKEKGVVQPILVRPMKNGKYQIVYGERR